MLPFLFSLKRNPATGVVPPFYFVGRAANRGAVKRGRIAIRFRRLEMKDLLCQVCFSEGRACHVRCARLGHPFHFVGHDERAPPSGCDKRVPQSGCNDHVPPFAFGLSKMNLTHMRDRASHGDSINPIKKPTIMVGFLVLSVGPGTNRMSSLDHRSGPADQIRGQIMANTRRIRHPRLAESSDLSRFLLHYTSESCKAVGDRRSGKR